MGFVRRDACALIPWLTIPDIVPIFPAIMANPPCPMDFAAQSGDSYDPPEGHAQGSTMNGLARGHDAPDPALPVFEVPRFPGWYAIGPIRSHGTAEEWRFVLRAVNVGSWISTSPDGLLFVMVPEVLRERAARELGEYELEQRERRAEVKVRDVPLHARSWWAPGIAAALMAFFLVTGPLQSRSLWFQHGIADTNQILAGALQQTVTALTLHSDASHALGNAMVGGLFLSAVHRRFGAGFGTFVVVSAGAAGNLLNALWHGSDHRSLGASTAVMAALGVLTAAQLLRNRTERPRMKAVLAWAPIAGGLALLGTFGASPHSDLKAHGFGFLTGVLLGLGAAFVIRNRTSPLPPWSRISFGLATVGMVVGAWAVALFPRFT